MSTARPGPAGRPGLTARRVSFAAERRRFTWRLLLPTLAVLMVVTLLPTLYLLVTSFTPLNLTRPETAWDFSTPLANYRLLLQDQRLHDSLWTQAKLSFWTVGLAARPGLRLRPAAERARQASCRRCARSS